MPDPLEHHIQATRLGSYEFVRKLARGGMAELFLARSIGPEGFEKLVVLKKILPRHAANPRFVQLFLDEAKLAASLDHPNIAHAYDMGRVDGHYFFTMEYVHGQDARSILRRADRMQRPVPIGVAVQLARAIAAALHYAHERTRPDGSLLGIVHRDVSPSNVLVSYDGAIKLADFGVAKASSSSVRTRTGTLKGKVGYMSPEQARGQAIDRRSDVFSLGVCLWELLSLKRLFKTDNDLATIQAIIHAPPPSLVELRPDTPPELQRIIERALEKDPKDRFQSAQEMQRELEELAREHKLSQSPLAISSYLAELFASELAAMREARLQGGTITQIYVAPGSASGIDMTTPVSSSGGEASEFADLDDEDLADDADGDADADADDDSDVDRGAQLAPAAGSIDAPVEHAADMEKTALAPPPIMVMMETEQAAVAPLAPIAPLSPIDSFDQMATTVQGNPFDVETHSGAAPAMRAADDSQPLARSLGATPSSVLAAQAAMPPPLMVAPLATPPGFAVSSGQFSQSPHTPTMGAPSYEVMDLTSRQRKVIIVSGIVLLAGVLVIAIVAAITGDGRPPTQPAKDTTETRGSD